jgi:hypothetical protein
VECDEFFVMTCTVFFISKFRTNLLAANHLITRERTKFDNEQKYSKFLLEIMTLVINITVGWNVTPSDLVNRYQGLKRTCYLHLQGNIRFL